MTLPRELEDFIPEVSFYLLLLLSNFDLSVLVGGGVLQDEAQREEVAVAPPHVQWHSHLCKQVKLVLWKKKCTKNLCRTGKYDLEVTTFQMAVLFCWENRSTE